MRVLMTIVVLAALAWSGFWWISSAAIEKGVSAWLEQQRRDGWLAEAVEVSTGGFPYRFDTTLTGLELADPGTGLGWSAPLFQVLALSYQPNHVIAIWPGEQKVLTPFENITLASTEMQASAVFEPNSNITLSEARLVVGGTDITSSRGWDARLESGLLASRQTEGVALGHDIGFEAKGFRPSHDFRRALDPTGVLPEVIETLKIDASLVFNAPWDRFAVEDQRPQVTKIDLKLLSATWGNLDLRAAGEVEVDAEGFPSGEITIKASNWREMLAIGVAAGWVPKDLAGVLEGALETLAGLSGNPKTLDAPLVLSNRRVFFGPVPIGKAPNLTIR